MLLHLLRPAAMSVQEEAAIPVLQPAQHYLVGCRDLLPLPPRRQSEIAATLVQEPPPPVQQRAGWCCNSKIKLPLKHMLHPVGLDTDNGCHGMTVVAHISDGINGLLDSCRGTQASRKKQSEQSCKKQDQQS